jgi:SAM-dependent methyltransferase
MTSAGYLDYDPASERFELPPEHAPVLAREGGPLFLGGMYQMLVSVLDVLGPVQDAFRSGGGVPYSSYPDQLWEGLDRFTCRIHNNVLVQQWIPLMPDVQDRLDRGVKVADVGCGRGRALLNLAAAFPSSEFVGYDVYPPTVAHAQEAAAASGLADRVRFACQDVALGLPEPYELIFTVDTVHDAVDPRAFLQTVRRALTPDGCFVCVDINCAENMQDNRGPLASLRYAISVLY